MKDYDIGRSIHGEIHRTTVQGTPYTYWQDFTFRATIARNEETGEIREIFSCGYVSKDLRVRKQIAIAYHLSSFRK